MSSLASVLARSHQSIPSVVLEQCSVEDRVVVENIALVAQEHMPSLNLALAVIVKDNNKYLLSLPCNSTSAVVTLRDLRATQTYNPGRVHDIRIASRDPKEGGLVVRIDICNESAPLACSELEVVRLTKRSRWF